MFDRRLKALQGRALTSEEYEARQTGLRSPSAFTVRRSQLWLMREAGLKAAAIGRRLRCSDPWVRAAIQALEAEGVTGLQAKSRARHRPPAPFDVAGREGLKSVSRQSARSFGSDSSRWTLARLAQVAQQPGYRQRQVTPETVGRALARRGSPGNGSGSASTARMPTTPAKKRRDWLKVQTRQPPEWRLLDEDAGWFSRFAQPPAHA